MCLRTVMEQSSTRTAGCDDSKGVLPCSILHASWPPARRCPTCGTAEVCRPNACSTQSCLGTPEMLAFTGRVGCSCCQSPFTPSFLPPCSLALRPPRAGPHASAPGPLRSQTVTRSFFTVCSACASQWIVLFSAIGHRRVRTEGPVTERFIQTTVFLPFVEVNT